MYLLVGTYPGGPFHPRLIVHRPHVVEARPVLGELLTEGGGERLIEGLTEISSLCVIVGGGWMLEGVNGYWVVCVRVC